MNQVPENIGRFFDSADGELWIGGKAITAIVAQYGTPLFVYDSSIIDLKLALLRDTFPSEFLVSYSVKANPNGAILRHLITKECGLEIASGGEFHLGLSAGCLPSKMIFAGPGKTEAELELVLRYGIGEIHVESILEVDRLSTIASRLGVQARVAVRVNPAGEVEGGAMRMGAKAAPFGVDEEDLYVILDRIVHERAIKFQGIHLFTGTQILDYAILVDQYRNALQIARKAASHIGQPLQSVDFGGGFGVPYFQEEKELDLKQLRQGMRDLMAEVKGDWCFSGTQFMVEPGRFLVAEAGIYVVRANDIKTSRGKKFVVVDGGMNHHLAASGNLGQTIKRNFPIVVLNKVGCTLEDTVDVVGPLCTPLDVLARSVLLPKVNTGDIVGIFHSGAYARTASPWGFLSHPSPPEVWIHDGKHYLIRRRGTHEDYLRDQCFLRCDS